jgi:glycerol-3-phosphate acyltransferase PlsY
MLAYLFVPVAYRIGSVSSAVVIARLMGLQDPREVGSGNPGATNMLRYGGRAAAALTLMGDVLKGALAVLVARMFSADALLLSLVGLAVFLGHLYPLFFGFRGGKGVATALGVWLALNPWTGLALAGTWLLMAGLFRYSSLSALTAAALAPLYAWIFLRVPPYVLLSIVVSALLMWRHRTNLQRLLAGQEGKIGRT